MHQRHSLLRVWFAAIAGVALAGLAAVPAAANEPAPTQRHEKFEIDFLVDTIDHHFLAVRMGELCADETTPPPPASDDLLRERCANIVVNQREQIQTMQAWLLDWYGIQKEPELPPGGDPTLEKLASVGGEDLDVAVAKQSVRYHWVLLPQAGRCTEVAYHQELADLCAMMYNNQLTEVDTFISILNDHGLNRSGPEGQPGGR